MILNALDKRITAVEQQIAKRAEPFRSMSDYRVCALHLWEVGAERSLTSLLFGSQDGVKRQMLLLATK